MNVLITSTINKFGRFVSKISEEESMSEAPAIADPGGATPVEDKDQDTLLAEHVKNNIDKYRKAFEAQFPKAQMVARTVEYHGATDKDKIRVMVEFETPILNFDALGIMSNKDIGIEAIGEKTFRVYNIYLPKVKDSTTK